MNTYILQNRLSSFQRIFKSTFVPSIYLLTKYNPVKWVLFQQYAYKNKKNEKNW